MVWERADRPPRSSLRRRRGARDRAAAHSGRRLGRPLPAPRRSPARRRARPAVGAAARWARDVPRRDRPVGRVPAAERRDERNRARSGGGDDGRRDRRLPPPAVVAEARRAAARRGDPDRFRRLRAAIHVPGHRGAPGAALDRHPDDRRRDRRRHEHGQLPRRARRAGGGRVRDLRRDVLRDRARLRPRRAGCPGGDRLRRVPRLPAPQLLSGAHLHGRLRRAAPRLHARDRLGPGAPEDGGVGDARAAAARARGARCSTRRSWSRSV